MPAERKSRIFSATAWNEWLSRRSVKLSLKALQFLLVGGVVIYLIGRVSEIGWGEVRRSLPESIWFYLLFGVMYFVIPVSELVSYKAMRWPIGFSSLPMFVRKRVYQLQRPLTCTIHSGPFQMFAMRRWTALSREGSAQPIALCDRSFGKPPRSKSSKGTMIRAASKGCAPVASWTTRREHLP